MTTLELLLIAATALFASGLTFFSGFGLGTILTPVFVLFFPVPIAIAATAFVHLANNLFKLILMWPHVNWRVALRFALPAMIAAIAGAALLYRVDSLPVLASYTLFDRICEITVVKVVIGLLIILFAWLELSRRLKNVALSTRWLPVGGLVSGFFGGLSGNQGALRSAFLIKAGLGKEGFIATGVIAAVVIDVTRVSVYGGTTFSQHLSGEQSILIPVAVGTASAFAGALIGKRLLSKITLTLIQRLVATLMMLIGMALVSGLI